MNQTETQSANKVPSSLTQVGITMKYSFLDYFRSRRFFILLLIAFLISALLTILVGYYRPPSFVQDALSFYGSWWGTSTNFVIILSGIFFGGDAISGEFQNRTGYFQVPNPIRRSSIYIGKWLSAFIAASMIFLIYAAIAVGNGLYYFGANVPIQFVQSLFYAWFYLAAVMGFTFFFSSLFKSSTISILLTAILFFVVFNIIDELVSTLVKIEPWFSLTYGGGIIGSAFSLSFKHVVAQTAGRFSTTTYYAYIPEGLAIIGLYFIITAALGLILFERKEFT